MKRLLSLFLAALLALGGFDAQALRGSSSSGSTTAASIATAQGGEDSVTAFAGGGQASATQLSSTVTNHRVTPVATAGDSVKLPAATVGQAHYVRNDGAASMQVFGQATETINGVASATGISQAPGMGVWYVCTTAGAWTTSPVSTITATTKMLIPDGTVGTPGLGFTSMDDGTGTGIYSSSGGIMDFAANGIRTLAIGNNSVFIIGSAGVVWGTSNDTAVVRASANSLQFGSTSATTTARTELNKSVTGIADAAATSVLTITVPNAAHSASVQVRLTCSLGAGGAIGANEATASNTYLISLTRTAGVNATAAISTAFGGAATAVAGAATVTATAAMSVVSGAVGATNTFTVNATVTRSGGSSTNHTCLVYAVLMNANASGVTIS